MTRTLTLTAAEAAALAEHGEAWIVRPLEPNPNGPNHGIVGSAPAELVAAAAPCSERWCDRGFVLYPEWPCPDCRITLVVECETCEGRGRKWRGGAPCACEAPGCDWGTVTLGYAYAASEVQMIWRLGVPAEGTQWATLVATLGYDCSPDIGKYALKVVAP